MYIKQIYTIDEKRKQQLDSVRHLVDYKKRNSSMSERMKKLYADGKIKPRTGSDSHLWRGGIATLQNSLRQTPVYKEWRKQVYGRDGYTCQNCGTNKDLHAHHIKTFSKYPELRYEVTNGLTVCRKCHGEIHGRQLPDIANASKLKVRIINKGEQQ